MLSPVELRVTSQCHQYWIALWLGHLKLKEEFSDLDTHIWCIWVSENGENSRGSQNIIGCCYYIWFLREVEDESLLIKKAHTSGTGPTGCWVGAAMNALSARINFLGTRGAVQPSKGETQPAVLPS